MAFKTLTSLIELVRQHADMEDDGNFIDDDEVTAYINASIAYLHSLGVGATDGTLFAKNAGIMPQIGDFCFQLPSDFDKLLDVSILDSGRYYSAEIADPQDYARLSQLDNIRERFFLQWNYAQGRAELFIFPAPEPENIAVRYVPSPPVLSVGSDELKFPTFWYMFVVLDAAIKCLTKEESDPSALMAERDRYERRVRDHINSMIPTQVKTIRWIAGRRGYYHDGEELP